MPQSHLQPLVLVTTTFYPHAVVGSVRAANWARMLPDLGWKPIVLSRWYGPTATRDLLDRNVHRDCDVIYVDGPWAWQSQHQRDAAILASGVDPNRPAAASTAPPPRRSPLARAKAALGRLELTRPILVPAPSILFWRANAPRVRQIVAEAGATMLITCGPPHSVHTVGFEGRTTPWVLDFQDPYLMDVRFRPQGASGLLTRRRHIEFKRRCIDGASALIQANAFHERWVRLRFPEARPKCRLLEPVCPRDILEGTLEPDLPPPGVRSIRVVGFIADEESLILAQAVRTLADRTGVPLELRFVGKPPATAGAIVGILGSRAVFTGPLVHEQAKRQILGADVLVSYLSAYRSTYHGISSKLYEFVAARKPIIHINPTAPDRHLLRQLPHVDVLTAPTPDQLGVALERALTPQAVQRAATDPGVRAFLASHSWQSHADQLARILRTAAASRQPDEPSACPVPTGA